MDAIQGVKSGLKMPGDALVQDVGHVPSGVADRTRDLRHV